MKKSTRRSLVALLLLFLLFPGNSAPAFATASLGDEIEAYVAAHQDTTAGLSVAVFDAENIRYQNCFGYADLEKQLPVREDTVFEWGSATKLLVWVSVMQLWEAGKLDLDADIQAYLPEGFLTNLRYDTPVTMTDLMNHRAGFQELLSDIMLKDVSKVSDLGSALLQHEPVQVFAPDTVTAYSNWGVALAGYIVECVSGQPFYAYVQEHIFSVLGMAHTALAPDLSDNPWVQEKRQELQCYTTEAVLIPDCFYHIPIYPAGMSTGIAADFTAFAQALLREDCPLFTDPNTRHMLFTPSDYYGDTGIPRNYHGFWMLPYGGETVGHGGNTIGCSSYLALDLQNGLGAVVMTNQSNESVYNVGMMEQIFGKLEPMVDTVPKGIWRAARNVFRGPLKVELLGFQVMSEKDLEEFFVPDSAKDVPLLSYPYGDLMQVSLPEFIWELGLVLLWALGLVFSLCSLLAWPISALIRRARHKDLPLPDKRRGLRRAAALLQLLLGAAIVAAALLLIHYAHSSSYTWLFALCGLLALAMLLVFFLLLKGREAKPRKAARVANILTAVFLLTSVLNVAYWNLFMFWAV